MVVAIFSANATNTFFWNIDSTRAISYDLQHDRIDQILNLLNETMKKIASNRI